MEAVLITAVNCYGKLKDGVMTLELPEVIVERQVKEWKLEAAKDGERYVLTVKRREESEIE